MSDALEIEERVRLAIKIGSHYREFKSAIEGPQIRKRRRDLREINVDVGRTLVAFANADGGELLVGIEDDGSVTGIEHNELDINLILTADVTHIHADTPVPPPRKACIDIDGKKVVYFSVLKGTQFVHLTSDGRCLRRVDRESLLYSAEKITADRLEYDSRTWDRLTAAGATIEDLDLDLIESVASQVAYGISVEKCLQYLGLAEFTPDGLRLNRAAALLFAKEIRRFHPGCFVRIITVQGNEKPGGEGYKIKNDEVVSGNVLSLVDQSWDRLTHALSMHTQLTETAKFHTTLMFPQIAVREALVNAIVHRNYAIEGRGVEIYIYQDRMEILSPGMLLSTISLEDIKALKGVHESRNPTIARVLREVGFVREMGEGIPRMFNVIRESALSEPEIETDTAGFSVTLFHRSMYADDVKLWLSTFDKHNLTNNQLAILALGYGGIEFSTQDIIDRLGIVDTDQVQQNLTRLRTLGLVVRTLTHQRAINIARTKGIPKREVKAFKIFDKTGPLKPVARDPVKVDSVSTKDVSEEGASVDIFLANIEFGITKTELVNWLSSTCDVRSLKLPISRTKPSQHRGYGFATIGDTGNLQKLLSKLDGCEMGGRKIHVSRANRNLSPHTK